MAWESPGYGKDGQIHRFPFNATGEAFAPVAKLAKAAMERGLYLMTHWNVIIVSPPLTITREELDEGLGVLDEVLALETG